MRILVITPYFQPVIGGSQNYIVGLFAAMRKLDPTIKVDVLTYNTEHVGPEETINGLHVYRVPAFELLKHQFAIPNYWSVLKLLRKLKVQHSYDIVNSHTRFFENSWWTPLAAKYLHAKSILTDHCAAHPSHANRLIRAISKSVDYLAIKLVLPRYDQVTVVSQATKKFLESKGTMGNIAVISGGVDLVRFEKERTLPSSLAFLKKKTKNTRVISFIGRLIPAKGVGEFLKAAQELSNKKSSLHFVIAGDGELLASLKQTETDQIHVVGALTTKGVTALLQRTDILIHPSIHHEGLPLTILEAGAAGCAVVATEAGQTKQLLGSGRGLVCQPSSDSIVKQCTVLLANRKRAKDMSDKLRQYVHTNYSWQQSAQKFQQLLVKIA